MINGCVCRCGDHVGPSNKDFACVDCMMTDRAGEVMAKVSVA